GASVLDEPHVADEAGVQDGVHGLDVVRRALREPAHAGPLGLREGTGSVHAPPIAHDWHHEKVHLPLSYGANMGYTRRMPRRGAMLGTLSLDRGGEPLHRRLYGALREAILAGRLRPGPRLPATRVLARDVGAARNTVVAAFEQLVAEGYLQSRVGDGTRVAAVLPETLLHARRAR